MSPRGRPEGGSDTAERVWAVHPPRRGAALGSRRVCVLVNSPSCLHARDCAPGSGRLFQNLRSALFEITSEAPRFARGR